MERLSWWDVVGRSRGDQKYIRLALFLFSFADAETGRLPEPPKTLMRNVFGDENWGRINNTVDQMRIRGILSNKNPKGGACGEWYVHLPEDIKSSAVSNAVLVQAAQDFIGHFGPEMVPRFIEVLKACAGK